MTRLICQRLRKMRRNRPLFTETSAVHRFLIWSEQRKNRPFYFRYGLPAVLVIIATVLKVQVLGPLGASSPFLLYFAIVCLCTITAGIGPAIVAIIISAVAADYFFILPKGEFTFTGLAFYKIVVFLGESTFIILLSSVIMSSYRRVNRIQTLFRAMIEKGSEGIVLTNREGKEYMLVHPSSASLVILLMNFW